MPFFRSESVAIWYWAKNKIPSPGRPLVLFIHGAGGSQLSWSFQKAFFERDFDPVLIDLPGHGESGGQGEEEIERYAGDVRSFLKSMAVLRDGSNLFLVGHSMGGAIVQTLALSHPGSIRGIVLVGTGARLRVMPAVFDGIRSDFEETVGKIVRFAFSRKAPQELIEGGIEHLLKCRPEVLYGDFLACDRFDFMKEVGRIDLPTLVVCGEEDEMTPVKYSEYLHHQIKSSKLEVLGRAGHMVMMESPETFNQKVGDFVAGILS